MPFDPSKKLIKLKSKDYLEVKWRIAWLHDHCKEQGLDFCIVTELVSHDLTTKTAVCKATVGLSRDGEGTLEVTGYGMEEAADFEDYLEKAETKAIGRALALAGFGTQFAPEMDFEDVFGANPKVVDSPVTPSQKKPAAKADSSFQFTG